MSVKRNVGSMRTLGGPDAGAKAGRQELYDELTKLLAAGQAFTPLDVSLSIGAGEPQVSRLLLGLAAEGCLDKTEQGKYRVSLLFGELSMAEFTKAFSRATKTDTTRLRDLNDISRLKQNNDVMRAKLMQAIAERDHYKAACARAGIDAGPAPAPAAVMAAIVQPSPSNAPPPVTSDGPPAGA